MKNFELAKIFNTIADILELQEVPWKPQAYRKAAQALEALSEDIEEVYQRDELKDIPGVGEHIAAKIEEFLQKGKIKFYEELKKKVKVDIEALRAIPTLGPKKIKLLYQKLGVKTVKDLEQVIKQGKAAKLEGFGDKTVQLLSQGIEVIKSRPQRFLYIQAVPIVKQIKEYLSQLKEVQKVEAAGSFRRGKETIGDLDFLVVSPHPEKVMLHFTAMKSIKTVLAKGITKTSVRLLNNLQVDLRVVQEKEFGSAMLYFIGNKEHNIEVRKLALSKGYTLSEYGLFTVKSKKWIAGRTEEEIYSRLGLQFIPPEIRRAQGEIAAAQKNKIPVLVELKDVQGMFHNHTQWSDGHNTLLEMARKAEELKFKFISFNDHYGAMGITNPLNEKRLDKYLQEIDKVRKKVGLKIFSGVEIDVLKDGSLPLSSKHLKKLDAVVASVHQAMRMPAKEMTNRICAAISNYPVNILGHPTGRLLNEREPMEMDWERVFQTAKDNNVFMEINGSPKRLDLSGELVKQALDLGCKFAISTDAHDVSHLEAHDLGVIQARRGWARKKDLLNCWTLSKIEKSLER
ncbi:MAG TPA: DNA polymerase/3'-5' exonuclease PolX [Candidatus Nanoarchaeia archaeon]|nr:DNA polymerase/3'-5' exonuclease PolX [Candidatus Nanoarchaeia archaeon]